LDDRTLVQGLLKKDPEAQRYFDQIFRPKLYRACCHLLGYKDSEAEDVVQDTFIAALGQLPSFQFRSSLFRWLYQIAMYKSYRVIRKRRRQVSTLQEDMEQLAAGEALKTSQKEAEELDRRELVAAIREVRVGMGEPCQTLLKKRDEEGLTYGQLAEALKIPVGTVMSRLARCMDTLRNRLAQRRKGGEQ
jgi:RNA polymerase sigma-70 factor (ECF subfamily)